MSLIAYLNDIQLIYHKLMARARRGGVAIDSLKDRFQSVVEVWDQRNDLVRKTIKCQEPVSRPESYALNTGPKGAQYRPLAGHQESVVQVVAQSTRLRANPETFRGVITFLLK